MEMKLEERYQRYRGLKLDAPAANVLRITLDNGKLNSVNSLMHKELAEIWRDIDADTSVHVVIVTGAGAAYSAGGDFTLIDDVVADAQERAKAWKETRDIVYGVINCSKPVVSAMRGVAVGAGLACALLADISIATPDCRILDGHVRLGVAAGDHAAIVWPLLCGMAKAKLYLLLCDPISGTEAERLGLISLVCQDDHLDAKALDLASRLARGSQSAIRWTKYTLNNWLRQAGPIFDASLALEMLGMVGDDVREGLASLREKRAPKFEPFSPL